jgi:hypothetical protein
MALSSRVLAAPGMQALLSNLDLFARLFISFKNYFSAGYFPIKNGTIF